MSKTIEKAIEIYEELWQLRGLDRADWGKIHALEEQVEALWQAAIKPYEVLFGEEAAALGTLVGPGWWEPLLQMLDDMSKIPNFVGNFQIAQIKEKFGGLRCYLTPTNYDRTPELDEAFAAALKLGERAEQLCDTRCERCGEPGEARSGGWVKTACDRHAKR